MPHERDVLFTQQTTTCISTATTVLNIYTVAKAAFWCLDVSDVWGQHGQWGVIKQIITDFTKRPWTLLVIVEDQSSHLVYLSIYK